MQDIIREKITDIEQSFHVKILYACETGSHAWALASKHSDYDVRFIYVHPINDYLSIDPIGIANKRDTIQQPIHELLDISGWELTKALRLFRKSNPSLLEWLHSPIIYYRAYSTIDQMRKMMPIIFDHKACILHYVNTAKANYYKKGDSQKNSKGILNIIRPILVANWLQKFRDFPPFNLILLAESLIDNKEIVHSIHTLIHAKLNETQPGSAETTLLLHYAFHEMKRLEMDVRSLNKNNALNNTDSLNSLFQETLKEVWAK